MDRKQFLFLSLILLLLIPSFVYAQNWSGIIDSARAIDWSTAGAGTIPNRTTVCSTIAPYSGTAATLNTAIANCPAGQVVQLQAGTFTISTEIDLFKSNVTLRGAGANQTFIMDTYTGSIGVRVYNQDNSCAGCSPSQNINVASWDAGYSRGSTSLTLNALVTGSSTLLQAGQVLYLDQLDDAADTGNVFVCSAQNVCSQQVSSQNGRPGRGQQQATMIQSVTGTGPWTVTVSPAVIMPNIRSGQTPQVWWTNAKPITGSGIENLSIDFTAMTNTNAAGFKLSNVWNCWITGVRSINAPSYHMIFYQSSYNTLANNYLYGTKGSGSSNYGTDTYNGTGNLVINNISQHVISPGQQEGSLGSVDAYNYSIDQDYTGFATDAQWQQNSSRHHGIGDAFILHEGNIGNGYLGDDVHGTSNFITTFRNYFTGREMLGGSAGGKTEQTNAVVMEAFSRYFNHIGNVLGTSGYHTNYETHPASATDAGPGGTTSNHSIFTIGWSGNLSTYFGAFPNDTVAYGTTMRWGNYDTVNALVQWNSGEVPSGISPYPNGVPATHTLPASFFLNSQPSWWATPYGTPAWPAIGPDVTSGNISGVGGFANKIPAQLCYENLANDSSYQQTYTVTGASWAANFVTLTIGANTAVLNNQIVVSGITPSGYNGTFPTSTVTGTTVSYRMESTPGAYSSGGTVTTPNIKTFSASTCYGTSTGSTPPAPPTKLSAVVQ